MRAKSHYLLTRLLPALGMAFMLFSVSSRPGTSISFPPLMIQGMDKLAHLVAYAILGALIFRAGKTEWIHGPSWRWVYISALIGSLYGLTDELHQAFVPHRTCSVWDWVFDSLGSGLGAWGWAVFLRKRRTQPGKQPADNKIDFSSDSA